MTSHEPRPRVAIIGSGISGLAAAWFLGERFEVTMFERRAALGLGAEGYEVDTESGSVRVDIPPRVFNVGHYQAMSALLAEVDMPTYEISQRPCFTDLRGRPYLGFDTVGRGTNTRSRVRLHPRTWRWLARYGVELYRWQRFLQGLNTAALERNESVATALDRLGFSTGFRDSFLYPMWALMCTCRFEHLDAFPAQPLFELARNFAGNFATLRLKGGTRGLEQRLRKRVHAIELARAVTGIEQHGDTVSVHTQQDSAPASFHHVILATDPRSTRRLLKDGPWDAERSLIAQVPVHETRMVLHTDTASLPAHLRSPVNIHCDADSRRASATLWMNPIEHERLGQTLLQSWEPVVAPADGAIKAQRRFQRSLMDLSSAQAMSRLRANMQEDSSRRVWYVGSYLGEGVPLLENGVRSARLVADLVQARGAQTGSLPAARIA